MADSVPEEAVTDDLSRLLRDWRAACDSAATLADTKIRAATEARDRTALLATEAAQVAIDVLAAGDRKITLTWKPSPSSVVATERERIKTALPELIRQHRQDLLYTPPEAYSERYGDLLARLERLIAGDS